jgi:uncharacterized protein (DUF1330 family)
MPAYIVALVEVTDPAAYEAYRRQTPGVIAQYGGRFLIRGGEADPLEGAWNIPRMVVIEFADAAAARRFYESPEYQAIVPLRQAASSGRLAILPGTA